MDPFTTKTELLGYYSGGLFGKSIQQSFRFYVTMIDTAPFLMGDKEQFRRAGPMPLIKHWHVLNINIPQYEFNKETQYIGPMPKNFAYMEMDGFDLNITFEEDQYGTIGYFVNWLARRMIDKDGLYTAPSKTKIDRILVETDDMNGIPIAIYTFHKCLYLKCDDVTYDYNSNDSVKYNIGFTCDYMTSVFPKKAALAAVQKGIIGTTTGIGQTIGQNNFVNNMIKGR